LHESPSALRERSTRPVDGESGTFLRHGLRAGRREHAAVRSAPFPRTGSHRATRRRGGFLLSEFFALAPIDVTAEILDRGPDHRDEAVTTSSLTDLTMALLLAAIEGRNLDQAVDRMELDGFVVAGGPHGPWLTQLPDALRDALAAADADDLRLYAARWLSATELWHADARAMTALLGEVAALARSAQARSDRLYLWTSL
jgi:hypothetical protein